MKKPSPKKSIKKKTIALPAAVAQMLATESKRTGKAKHRILEEALRRKMLKESAQTKIHPVPEYIDDDLKQTVSKLDVLQRHTLADKLERQAHQLRQMQQPEVLTISTIALDLRPQMKNAICAFAEYYGAKKMEESEKLAAGARWFLESSLPMIQEVSRRTDRFTAYRDAEGLNDSTYTEDLIRDALQNWTSHIAANSANEGED
jgi:hypothetical protein